MITKEEFVKIKKEVEDALHEAFDVARKKNENDYLIFLALGEYHDSLVNTGHNPYVIEYQLDKYKDHSRLKFLVEFLNLYYSFAEGKKDDNEYLLNLELMVYSHIWESRAFLKSLKRLTSIVTGKKYEWTVAVPDMEKHDFLRTEIRDELSNAGLNLATIITNGFHSSLRNAFAHADYSIDFGKKIIYLDNYKGANWELKDISFDDWSKRFCYSFLLSYSFLDLFYEKRKSIVKDLGTEVFKVTLPDEKGQENLYPLRYDEKRESFTTYMGKRA